MVVTDRDDPSPFVSSRHIDDRAHLYEYLCRHYFKRGILLHFFHLFILCCLRVVTTRREPSFRIGCIGHVRPLFISRFFWLVGFNSLAGQVCGFISYLSWLISCFFHEQEIIKLREVIPSWGFIPMVIPSVRKIWLFDHTLLYRHFLVFNDLNVLKSVSLDTVLR